MREAEADALLASLAATFDGGNLESDAIYEGSAKIRDEHDWLVVVLFTHGPYRYEYRQRQLNGYFGERVESQAVAADIRLFIMDEPAGDGSFRGEPWPLTTDGRYLRETFE